VATDADNVQVASTGGIYVAPAATAIPTSASASRNAAFAELGLMDESGVVESQGTTSNNIKAWQNGAVVRKVQTEHDLTYQFTAIETNPVVLEEWYGNYNSGDVQITGEAIDIKPWVLEVFDGDEHLRIVIPNGQITERGDVSYVNGAAVAYPITLTAYPDASGVKAYAYYAQDGAS
jgi:hypothetical protein